MENDRGSGLGRGQIHWSMFTEHPVEWGRLGWRGRVSLGAQFLQDHQVGVHGEGWPPGRDEVIKPLHEVVGGLGNHLCGGSEQKIECCPAESCGVELGALVGDAFDEDGTKGGACNWAMVRW